MANNPPPRPDTPGSTNLTQEQTDWYQQKFGQRYVGVPDRPPGDNRRQRRKTRYRPKSERR